MNKRGGLRVINGTEPLAERDLDQIVRMIAEADKLAPFDLNHPESGYLETERLMATIVLGLREVGRPDLIEDTGWSRGLLHDGGAGASTATDPAMTETSNDLACIDCGAYVPTPHARRCEPCIHDESEGSLVRQGYPYKASLGGEPAWVTAR